MNPMRLKHKKTLITGLPGVGKTTLVRKIVERMGPIRISGFYTAEVKAGGRRVGFELRGFQGGVRLLAHTAIGGPQRVGQYGVDTIGFEAFLKALNLLETKADLLVIDEIGKMELYSRYFHELIRDILDVDHQLLATVAAKGSGLIEEVKQRPDVRLYEITRSNRNALFRRILRKL